MSADMTRSNMLELLSGSSHVIFVSRNAARFADEIAGGLAAGLRQKSVFAVGDATAQELAGRKVYHVTVPEQPSGSETLLGMGELNTALISGANVLIVRGNEGRELLKDSLQDRGASVRYAEVYRRSRPEIAAEITAKVWQETRPDVILVTSEQGLQNLIEMTAAGDRDILFATRLVVISDRVKDTAKTSGFVHPPVVAADQSDQGLLQAIEKVWS